MMASIKYLQRVALCAIVLLCATLHAEGATRYASPSGSGTACTEISTPCTLNTAISQLAAGDTLHLLDGVYSQSLSNPLPSGSSASSPTIMEGQSLNAILRPPSGGGNVLLLNSSRNHLTFRGFTIDAVNLRTGETTGFRTSEGSTFTNLILEDLEVKNPQGAGIVIATGADNCILRRNKVHDSVAVLGQSGTAIYIRSGGCVIEYNEFYNFPALGATLRDDNNTGLGVTFRYNIVRANGSIDDPSHGGIFVTLNNYRIYRNLIFGNHKHGVLLDRRRTGGVFDNNTVYANDASGVTCAFCAQSGTVSVRNTISIDNGGTQISGTGISQTTNLTSGTASSIFVDPPASGTDASYSLALLSTATAAIDQGTDVSLGHNGSAPDIGAHERFTAANAEIGNVADNIIVLNLAMSLNTPVQITDETGWSTTCGTIDSVTAPSDAQLRFTLAGDYGGGGNCAISYNEATGNATDSIEIGDEENQGMSGLSSFAVSDNTGSTPTPTSSVQTTTNNGTGTSVACTYSSGPTAGNLLTAVFAYRGAETIPSAPSGWSFADGHNQTNHRLRFYYKIAASSESSTFAWTLSGSQQWAIICSEWDGIDPIPLDVTSDNSGTGTAGTTGAPGALANPEERVITAFANVNTDTWASHDNSQVEEAETASTGGAAADRVNLSVASLEVSATTDVNYGATLSGSQEWSAVVAAFKAASTGSTNYVFTQTHFRFHHITGTEASPLVIKEEDTNVTLPRGAAFRIRTKVACTNDDCPAQNFKLRYSRNGEAYIEVPDTSGADEIAMYGTAGDSSIPSEGTATSSEHLTNDQPTNVASIIVRTNSAIPNWDCSQNCEGEFEHILKLTTSATRSDTYDFRLYNQDGAILHAYQQTPRVTVGEYVASGGF